MGPVAVFAGMPFWYHNLVFKKFPLYGFAKGQTDPYRKNFCFLAGWSDEWIVGKLALDLG